MSVIFGIKENNRIIIAGDKRGSSIDGKTLSDDLDKVLRRLLWEKGNTVETVALLNRISE